MSHYYLNDEALEERNFSFDYTFLGYRVIFKSNSGVFSKKRVDFGTHVLLKNLPVFTKEKILDMGCGLGVIGLLIGKAYPTTVIDLVDINKRALELANISAKINNINNVHFIESNLYNNVTNKYNVIISNPPIRAGKKVVYSIFEDGFNYLEKKGIIYTVIQKKQGAESLIKKMEEIYNNVVIVAKEKGYYVLSSQKE